MSPRNATPGFRRMSTSSSTGGTQFSSAEILCCKANVEAIHTRLMNSKMVTIRFDPKAKSHVECRMQPGDVCFNMSTHEYHRGNASASSAAAPVIAGKKRTKNNINFHHRHRRHHR